MRNHYANQISNFDEWDDLYKFQCSYRMENGITAGDLLLSLQLPLSLTQYLYSNRSRPSNKPGSLGQQLRANLKNFKNAEKVTVHDSGNLSFQVQEFFQANKTTLRDIGVESLHLSDDEEGLLIVGNTPAARAVDTCALQNPMEHSALKGLKIQV
jgi:hypothetical protein